MSMWKQIFLVLFFIAAMYFGGLSTQSESSLMQGFGFIVIIIAFGLLYVISKVMWRAMGFMTSFFIIGSIVIFILYCLGLLGGQTSVKSFVSGSTQSAELQNFAPTQQNEVISEEITDFADLENAMFGSSANIEKEETDTPQEISAKQVYPNEVKQTAPKQVSEPKPQEPASAPQQQPQPINIESQQAESSNNFMDKIMQFFGQSNTESQADFNPLDYPYVEGQARVITASVLKINQYYIKMLGIDAPDPQQTCADKHGASYQCGQRALTWLQNWIHNRPIRCYVVGQIVRNRTTGVCFTVDGKYDLAAVVTNAGWALAWTQNTAVYVPYERQAAENRRGLWSGRFYKPWDWRKIQNRQVKITIKSNKSDSGFFDFLDGWF